VPPPPVDQLKSSLQRLAGVLVDRGAKAALRAVDRLSGKLEDISSRGGALTGAAAGGLKAVAAGKNPVLGAVKGAIGGLSTKTKVLIVLAIVLGLLLGPVALVLLLVGLLVFAIVAAVRSRGAPWRASWSVVSISVLRLAVQIPLHPIRRAGAERRFRMTDGARG
jgi:hypothetical protein